MGNGSRAGRRNLADHPDRLNLRANYLAALEYGVVGRSHAHKWRDRKAGGRACRCGAVEQVCPECAGAGSYTHGWDGPVAQCSTCHGEGKVTT